jgi:hypothetical protein
MTKSGLPSHFSAKKHSTFQKYSDKHLRVELKTKISLQSVLNTRNKRGDNFQRSWLYHNSHAKTAAKNIRDKLAVIVRKDSENIFSLSNTIITIQSSRNTSWKQATHLERYVDHILRQRVKHLDTMESFTFIERPKTIISLTIKTPSYIITYLKSSLKKI